ncbi:hypothetical protein [Bacillus canaveralius]|nr:hypothetical protein [Bacillus canaveralius]
MSGFDLVFREYSTPFKDKPTGLGKMVTLHIDCGFEFSQTVKGTAEVFYFEGTQQFHRGLKYVNDFFVEDDDIIELLVKHEGKKLKLTATIL